MTTSYDGFTVEESVIHPTTATGTYVIDGCIVLEHHLLLNGEVHIVQVDVTVYATALARGILDAVLDLGAEED